MKEETIEEAAEICFMSGKIPVGENKIPTIKAFIAGANWQKEQYDIKGIVFSKNHIELTKSSYEKQIAKMYTEEEVKKLFKSYQKEFWLLRNIQVTNSQFKEWFKKK